MHVGRQEKSKDNQRGCLLDGAMSWVPSGPRAQSPNAGPMAHVQWFMADSPGTTIDFVTTTDPPPKQPEIAPDCCKKSVVVQRPYVRAQFELEVVAQQGNYDLHRNKSPLHPTPPTHTPSKNELQLFLLFIMAEPNSQRAKCQDCSAFCH